MLKLKSAMRLRKGPDDGPHPCGDEQPAASLQRSNAKLRKRDSSADGNEEQQFSAAVPSPVQDDMFHFGIDSRQNSWDQSKQEVLSPGAAAATPKTGNQNRKAFSKFLSKAKAKQKQAPPLDNFTKWDSRLPSACHSLAAQPSISASSSNPAASIVSGGRAFYDGPWSRVSGFASHIGCRAPVPTDFEEDERYYSISDESNDELRGLDSMSEENGFDGIASKPKGKGRMPGIADIDWNDFADKEALKALLASIASFDDQQRRDVVSPADSGVGMMEEDESPSKHAVANVFDPDMWMMDEQRLQQEIEATTQMWSDRLHALGIQKEQELERQRQEEEDRKRAEALAEEERLEREQQEAEDLRRALEIQEEEERKAAELARRRDCIICDNNYDPSELPLASPQCEHDAQTCSDCMQQWLASEFTAKGCSDLRCPECPQPLEYADIQRLASEETFASYEKLLTRTALASLEEFAWCLKGDECNSGQLNEDNNNFMDCQNCGYKQCLKCKVPWHTGETCEQYEYRSSGKKQKDEEEATEKMIDDISKKCPGKNCGWRIQKTDGCDHMTCKKCKWEFCWECLASHREIKRVGNTAHDKKCKFHSDNLETAWPFNMHA